ncbi:MAG: glycosyltransferase [Cyanobacteria bacterium P01_B01_bin.77]
MTDTMRVLAQPLYKTENPYAQTVYAPMAALGVDVQEFSAKRLLFGRYDIWHRHWPERALNERNLGAVLLKLLAAVLCTWVARLKGIRIVWTAHNLQAHEQYYPSLEKLFWFWFTRNLDGYISLSHTALQAVQERFPNLKHLPGFVIPHSHYRGQYLDTITSAEARRHLNIPPSAQVVLLFGKLRPYKNVSRLIQVFQECAKDQHALYIVGSPATSELAHELSNLGQNDRRVQLVLERIDDHNVQYYFRAADLVVLPYSEVLNSGAALLSLSFDCPVLAPSIGSLAELGDHVGASWFQTYSGELTAAHLLNAIAWAASSSHAPHAPLGAFSPETISKKTVIAYQTLLSESSIPLSKEPA